MQFQVRDTRSTGRAAGNRNVRRDGDIFIHLVRFDILENLDAVDGHGQRQGILQLDGRIAGGQLILSDRNRIFERVLVREAEGLADTELASMLAAERKHIALGIIVDLVHRVLRHIHLQRLQRDFGDHVPDLDRKREFVNGIGRRRHAGQVELERRGLAVAGTAGQSERSPERHLGSQWIGSHDRRVLLQRLQAHESHHGDNTTDAGAAVSGLIGEGVAHVSGFFFQPMDIDGKKITGGRQFEGAVFFHGHESGQHFSYRGLQQEGFDRDRPDTADGHADFLSKQGDVLVESFRSVVPHVRAALEQAG